ncbi:EGF-like domain containing protein, partial [Oryctes borbonicus]
RYSDQFFEIVLSLFFEPICFSLNKKKITSLVFRKIAILCSVNVGFQVFYEILILLFCFNLSFRMLLQFPLAIALIISSTVVLRSQASLWETENCRRDADKFLCRDGGCIDRAKKCNNQKDCVDGSDESDCGHSECLPPEFFKCVNEVCVSHFFRCDDQNDCGDWSDEKNCENVTLVIGLGNKNCSEGEWQCLDKLCIPEEWVCNDQVDCLDGSDEMVGCTKTLPCDAFQCKNGHCVPNEWRCDKSNDCGDNSDEESCENHIDPAKCLLEDRLFLCSNNQTCLPLSGVCDGKTDCPDGTDEGSQCQEGWYNCQMRFCSHECVQLPNGPKCVCPQGYHAINETVCEDINECEIYGVCDQKCKNTPGSYECQCDKRYVLQDDQRTCKADGGEAMMVFSSKTEIRGYFLQSQLYFPIAKRLRQVIGVGFDGHHVYWTDIFSGHESITRSAEDGSNRDLLVTTGLGAPEDLAIDWVTGNIYFTDSEMQHIGVCSNNGDRCSVIVNEDIDKPRGIVLNPAEGEMFWTDWGAKPLIGRSLMDGSKYSAFVTKGIHWPNGIAIDYPNERLYWVDAKHQTLESVRLNGTDRRIVLQGIVKHPYAIGVFEDKLYWSDWNTRSIQTCDKFTGKNRRTLLKEKKEYIYGLHIFHSALKRARSDDNPCAKAYCSDLCLLSGQSYSCACPQDKILSEDKHICLASQKKQILVIGGRNVLAMVEHRSLGKHELTALPTFAKDVIALTYSPVNGGTLFISDAYTNSILSVNSTIKDLPSQLSANVIFHGETDSRIVSMAYDHAGNNLYWCDEGKATVDVLSLRTRSRKVLMHNMAGETPTAITVIPNEGVMFVAFRKPDHGYHIDRFRMDGNGRTHIVDRGLLGPITLFYEFSLHRVFWADAGIGTIETTSVEGDDRHNFQSLHTNPISLASLDKDIFWTNAKSKRLFWTNKLNTDSNRKITLELPDGINSFYIVSATSKPIPPHPCHADNGNCSHICLPGDNIHFFCTCPIGMNLRADNATCYKPLECAANEFFCGKSDACVPITVVCDGRKDCLHGDDEEECPAQGGSPSQCDHLSEFRCADGDGCVKTEVVCDMHYDCADRSDEDAELCANSTAGVKTCPDNDFRCNSGTCIANRFVCDGYNDCYNGEDETDCKFSTCSANEFKCASGSCIPESWECDREYDCSDLSDEHAGCGVAACTSDQFSCNNGRCVDRSLRCDRTDDCGDSSDEANCEEVKDDDSSPCKLLEYRCPSNRSLCLPQSAVCNGTAECPQLEDEAECSDCHLHEFQCKNGKCVVNEWICDGADDCGDASDEENELCSRKNETLSVMGAAKAATFCANGFRCKNGNCLDLSSVCNGQEDCYDGSDENGACNSSCKATDVNPCDHRCVATPSGPMCVCRQGFRLLGDGRTCVDIEECGWEPPVCSQLCTEMPGSFSCACRNGYVLRTDRRSCKSVGDPMSIIFVSGNQIRRVVQPDNSLSVLYSDDTTAEISDLDVSIARDLIYFSIKESGTIHRLYMKTYDREYMMNIGAPTKIAVDWITQNVYFVDGSGSEGVKVCNFQRKAVADLFKTQRNTQISAISVDPINKYLFYATTAWRIFNSPTSTIYRRNLDGTRMEVLKSNAGHVTGIASNPLAKRLYFGDRRDAKIYRLGYEGDGSSKQDRMVVIASNLTSGSPLGLQLFEDDVFFRARNGYMGKCTLLGKRMTRCDSFRIGGNADDPFAIAQISRQPTNAEDVCLMADCATLCVLADAGPKCLCADGSGVAQGETCDGRSNNEGEGAKPTLKQYEANLKKSSKQSSGSAIVGVVISLMIALFVGLGYLYVRRRNSGKFNISMKFYNPMFGVQQPAGDTESGTSIVVSGTPQPTEHGYCNPVRFNNQDMEAATNAILQKVTPLVKIDE